MSNISIPKEKKELMNKIGNKHGLMMLDPIQSYHIQNAMEEYAAQSKGMRWVKASELPKKVGGYWCKVERTVFKREVFFNGQRFDGEVIEWLDESTQEGGTVEATIEEFLTQRNLHGAIIEPSIYYWKRVKKAMTEYASQVSATDKKRISELEKEVERLREALSTIENQHRHC